ncbi:hypothetical protein B0T26DRAFT_679804 [Lasiosphaeria miniovina]|uniref:Heterokaryon incompatibility domain-containing protein n=1 Tax=Lasiosphaeria miniovina TaxID=1954250 RepID=A0AA39ZZ39_9PEZI|nr:uncharacterized protein B0T26DRAFT_679804 [Lasiosphaeria miniovina]KAK0706074.1 hypothetical protein B0T26DRAFT_679804 [Lasiosphaeria miniovina]
MPWFKRVWVVQEAALAKSCVSLWGREQMNIAELYELCHWLGHRKDMAATTVVSAKRSVVANGFLFDRIVWTSDAIMWRNFGLETAQWDKDHLGNETLIDQL